MEERVGPSAAAGRPVACADAPPPTTDVRREAERHLRALVGSEAAELREDQWRAIEALAVGRRRSLVVQRTGWGKSAVYFVATLLLRAEGAGPTVIVSPLLALMRNQIAAAERAGIRAVTINSTNIEAWEPIQDQIRAGEVDVLLVSPERLNNPGFRDEVLPRLAATCGLLVVDEAHCISDWGHDFRPDYRRIRTLLDDLPEGIPVLATTATANARVTGDVAEQLGSRPTVLVLRGSLDRESLRLGVVRLKTAQQRLAWLADHLAEQPGSGIVYCLTVAATQEIADYLRSRGHEVAAYSGQTETTERQALEQDLIDGRVKALIATSALGMGFDAALGFVVNMGAPQSPVAYYQQVGRAGRGLEAGVNATVVLLPALEDRDIWAYFASLAFPRESLVRETLQVLAEDGGPMGLAAIEARVELNRGRLETMLKVLDVDGAVRRVQGGWVATGQEWAYDEERYARVREAREREQQAMLDYLATDRLPDEVPPRPARRPGRRAVRAVRQLRRADPVRGRVRSLGAGGRRAAGAARGAGGASPDVAVGPAHAGHPAQGQDHRRRRGGPGRRPADRPRLRRAAAGAVPDRHPRRAGARRLARAVVALLQDWQPEVDAIVVVESATRPTLTADLANGLSRFLQVPIVGPLGDRRPGRRARPWPGQLGPADLRARAPGGPARGHRARAPRPARRRPDRHRLDDDAGGPGDPQGRGGRGAAAGAGVADIALCDGSIA